MVKSDSLELKSSESFSLLNFQRRFQHKRALVNKKTIDAEIKWKGHFCLIMWLVTQLNFLGMKNERIYGISVVDSNNTDYPKLCSPDNASNYSEKYQNGPYCGMHEVKNG